MPVLAGGTTFEGVPDEGLGFMIDLTERKRDEAEIRALKDQLYRENLALRDEVDRASMFEEIVGASPDAEAGSVPDRQGGSDRLHRVHLGRDWHGQGTRRPRRSQTIPEVWTRVRQRAIVPRSHQR